MILQALTQYYEDLVKQDKIARPGWTMQKVSYALCIGESGELSDNELERVAGGSSIQHILKVFRHGKKILFG